MKKLLLILACVIVSTSSYVISMEKNKIQTIVAKYPNKPKYSSWQDCFSDFAQPENIGKYIGRDYYQGPTFTSQFIGNVSGVDKTLNSTLRPQREDAVIARSIITLFNNRLKDRTCDDNHFIENLKFPGVNHCLLLSQLLYNDSFCTKEEVKRLVQRGAIIDYSVTYDPETGMPRYYPLQHWFYQSRNKEKNEQAKAIMVALLELGANRNGEYNSVEETILNDKIDITELFLNYKQKITPNAWRQAMAKAKPGAREYNDEYITLLLEHATQNELDAGLICCFDDSYSNDINSIGHNFKSLMFSKDIMNLLILKGANINNALKHLMKMAKLGIVSPSNDSFLHNAFMLADTGYDKEGHKYLASTHEILGMLLEQFKANRPSNNNNENV